MPIDPETGAGTHPLRVEDVLVAGGVTADPPPSDDYMFITCPTCKRHQSLTNLALAETDDPGTITVYL